MGVTSSKTKSKTKSAEKNDDLDLIIDTAKEIEDLSVSDALNSVSPLLETTDVNNFKLGGVLYRIQSEQWYENAGYESFKDYVTQEHDFSYRTAMYRIGIYKDIVESGIDWATVGVIGWSKLKEISHVITPENASEWVERAKGLTVVQLIEYMKSFNKKADDDSGKPSTKANITNMTFKLHDDQKDIVSASLDKAKQEVGTEYDTVALQHVCDVYVSGKLGKKSESLSSLMKTAGFEKVLEEFEKVFPEIHLTAEID